MNPITNDSAPTRKQRAKDDHVPTALSSTKAKKSASKANAIDATGAIKRTIRQLSSLICSADSCI